MGLIFNGNGDVIKAVDGSLTVEGLDLGGGTNVNAGIGTFSDLNITGTLTYEDVKNVDSVGIISARQSIHVGYGVSAAGIITATSYRGDGSQLTGITQVGGATTVGFDDNKPIYFGSEDDYKIRWNGTRMYMEPTSSSTTQQLEIVSNNQMYINSKDSGLFLMSANQNVIDIYGGGGGGIYFKHNGTQKLKLEGGNWTYLNSATVTHAGDVFIPDKIVHTGDTNTALRFPSADTFSVETAGSQRLNINSVGDVTLGYAGNSLYFQNGFNNSNARIQNGGASNNSNLKFYTRSSGTEAERLRIKSDGDVLIGTTTSAGKLTVDSGTSNTCATFQSSDSGAVINLTDNSARSSIEQNGTTLKISSDTDAGDADSEIRFQIDGSTKSCITSTERFGFGLTSPQTTIHVSQVDAGFWLGNPLGDSYQSGQNPTLKLYSDCSEKKAFIDVIYGGDNNYDRNITFGGSYLALHSSGASNGAETLRVTGGQVLIGATSWSYSKALNVQGPTGSILSLSNFDTTTYAQDTNTSIELKLKTGNTGNQDGACEIRAFKENGTNGNNARGLSFWTAGNGGSPAERLRITSSGQMGLGKTPSRMFEVKDSTGANRIMNIHGTGTSGAYLAFHDANTTDDSKCRVGCVGGNNIAMRGDAHYFQNGAGTNRMTISSSGYVQKPLQPRASVKIASTTTLSNSKITNWATATFNIGSFWDESNKRFVAPVQGYYLFGGTFRIGAPGKIRIVQFRLQHYNSANQHTATYGSGIGGTNNYDGGSSGYDHPYVVLSQLIQMDHQSYIELHCSEVSTEHTSYIQVNDMQSHMWGMLIA